MTDFGCQIYYFNHDFSFMSSFKNTVRFELSMTKVFFYNIGACNDTCKSMLHVSFLVVSYDILLWSYCIRKNMCVKCILTYTPLLYRKNWGLWGYTYIFLFLLQTIDYGYSLEPPRQGGSHNYILFLLSLLPFEKLLSSPYIYHMFLLGSRVMRKPAFAYAKTKEQVSASAFATWIAHSLR